MKEGEMEGYRRSVDIRRRWTRRGRKERERGRGKDVFYTHAVKFGFDI